MSDLIRREDAANLMYKMLDDDYVDGYAYLEQLRSLPTAEPERRWRTAKVDTRPFGDIELHKCHHCQYYVDRIFTYCPGCGARLEWV